MDFKLTYWGVFSEFAKVFYLIIVKLWYIWLIVLIPIILKRLYDEWYNYRLRLSGMDKIDKMKGRDFEKRIAFMFQDLGYKVKLTKATGDGGADIILNKDGIKTAVQVKRYSKKVSNRAVQEVVASLAKYKCQKGIVVTNNYFTQPARDLAKVNNIELWDREKLMKVLLSLEKAK